MSYMNWSKCFAVFKSKICSKTDQGRYSSTDLSYRKKTAVTICS